MARRNEGKRGMSEDRGGVSTATVQSYLEDIEYPKTKDEIIEFAEDNGAPDSVLDYLEQLPDDEEFEDAADLNEALGDIK